MKLKKFGNTEQKVYALAAPIITELGYLVWDVRFEKEGASWYLRFFIDSETKTIGISDCEKVHRAIDPILDEVDPIESFYYLDVSSPGIERDIRTEEHIELCIGQTVEAKLFAAKDGIKSFVGTLTAFSDGVITITEGECEIKLAREEISKLNTVYVG